MHTPQDRLHVVHVTLSVQGGVGGPVQSAIALCQSLAACGCKVDLCAVDWGKALGRPIPVDASRVTLHTTRGWLWPHPRMWWAVGFERMLREVAAHADILHSDGVWIGMTRTSAAVARSLRIPQIVSPFGELAPVALSGSAWKKAIARVLYAKRNLRQAACLHAQTDREAADARAFGVACPIAVIPNGIDLETFKAVPPPDQAGWQWPQLADKRIVLFLGRIHPIKGLESLVRAWCRLARRFGNWHLVIAGPDEVRWQGQLEAILRQAGVAESVTFTGPVYDREKMDLLAACGLLVLPSLSEGFGMSVVEALAAGKPVMTTVTIPWHDVVLRRCGWEVELGTEPLEQGLAQAMTTGEQERREMGERARRLVEEKYSSDRVAGQMAEVYRWLVHGGPAPKCVQFNGRGSHADGTAG